MTSNPWEGDPAFINLGGLKHILDTYKRFSASASQCSGGEKNSSVEYFDSLRNITKLNREQTKVGIELQSHRLYEEFYNILHTDVLDGMISMVDFLSQHLQQIIDHKQLIVDRLQKPFVGEYMTVDVDYHSDVCEFFPLIANNLADLSKILHNIEWINNYSIRNSNLSDTLKTVMSALSTLQRQYQGMNETRDLMNDLIKMKP